MAKIYGRNSKYLEQQHSYHSRNVGFYGKWIVAFCILGAGILIFGIVLSVMRDPYGLLIIMLGLFTAVVPYSVEKIALNHERSAHQFRQGQKGEWEVKVELSKLPDNFAVFCDAKFMGKNYNIDFIVSGPTGIYAIEVKSHKGNIIVSNIYQKYFDQVSRAALKLRDFLWHNTAEDIWIKPLLVYSSDEASIHTTNVQKAITVIHKKNLNNFILSQQDISRRFNIFKYENHLVALTGHNII